MSPDFVLTHANKMGAVQNLILKFAKGREFERGACPLPRPSHPLIVPCGWVGQGRGIGRGPAPRKFWEPEFRTRYSGVQSAIDADDLAGDFAGAGAAQEQRHRRDVGWFRKTEPRAITRGARAGGVHCEGGRARYETGR